MENSLLRTVRKWGGRFLWFLLGASVVVVIYCGTLEWGRKHVSRIYFTALKLKPATVDNIKTVFGNSDHIVIGTTDGLVLYRYRFLYGEDIDVIYDKNWHVVDIYPTFALSWGRPWLFLHTTGRGAWRR